MRRLIISLIIAFWCVRIPSKLRSFGDKLGWNQEQKVDIIFHLLPFLQIGKLRFTAIAETSHQASTLFKGAVEMLENMANKLNKSR